MTRDEQGDRKAYLILMEGALSSVAPSMPECGVPVRHTAPFTN
jgi:hypothetical protein